MYILGISAYYHDSAAALIADGKIIAAAQEERFTRKKHDARFPQHAIAYCLEEAKLTLDQVDAVVFYDKPFIKFERLLETYLAYAPYGLLSFIASMPVWVKEKLFLKSEIKKSLKQIGTNLPPLLFAQHHESHAASAYFPSPYDKAVVLCMDGVGEWATTSAWIGDGRELKPLWEIDFPHSIGLLYSAFTYYTGFKVNSGEYKLMGLAPYGEPRYVELIKKHLIDIKEDGTFRLDMSYFNYATGLTMTSKKFHQLFGGEPRKAESKVTQKEMDLARSIQLVTEEIVLKLATSLKKETGLENLCLAGGVALNCVANGRLLREGPFKNIWIQPAAGDAGGAIGAALSAWHTHFKNPRQTMASKHPVSDGWPDWGTPTTRKYEHGGGKEGQAPSQKTYNPDGMSGSYLGPRFTNDDVKKHLDTLKAPYVEMNDTELFSTLAKILDEGNVVGWCQGRMEFGPRALGGRSIIGDPRNTKMQTVMNLKIKYRESFRPFAPAVLAEKVGDYFELQDASPYMLLVAPVKKELRRELDKNERELFGIDKLKTIRSSLPAITHVDYSARVQTVHPETNPRFYGLIKAFEEKTGCGVLVNTSFNVRGEPIVCTPEDAYRCFMRTEMDYLVFENILIKKSDQPKFDKDDSWKKEFELD